MTIIAMMEVEIISSFAFLKNKYSSGYNGISNRILKFCGNPLDIFNKSLTAGKFLDHLEHSVLNLFLEKGKKVLEGLSACLLVFQRI
jgi:hypothetical protein